MSDNPQTLKDLFAELARPFDPASVDFKPGATTKDKQRCLAMAYADSRAYEARLDEALQENWSASYERAFVHAPVDVVEWENGQRVTRTKNIGKVAVTCFLTILGVTRCGMGECDLADDNAVTSAESQAFKRACSRFGLGRYLYDIPQVWVGYDEDRRRITDEGMAQLREMLRTGVAPTRQATSNGNGGGNGNGSSNGSQATQQPAANGQQSTSNGGAPKCPKCGGAMWDNRPKKASGEYSAKSPDFKCKTKTCDGVIWPPKADATGQPPAAASKPQPTTADNSAADDDIDEMVMGALGTKYPEKVKASVAEMTAMATEAGWNEEHLVGHIAKHYGYTLLVGLDSNEKAILSMTVADYRHLKSVLLSLLEVKKMVAGAGLPNETVITWINESAGTTYTNRKQAANAIDDMSHEERLAFKDYFLAKEKESAQAAGQQFIS